MIPNHLSIYLLLRSRPRRRESSLCRSSASPSPAPMWWARSGLPSSQFGQRHTLRFVLIEAVDKDKTGGFYVARFHTDTGLATHTNLTKKRTKYGSVRYVPRMLPQTLKHIRYARCTAMMERPCVKPGTRPGRRCRPCAVRNQRSGLGCLAPPGGVLHGLAACGP